jgi:hypothetical protein
VILDSGVLISIDRGEESAKALVASFRRRRTQLHTTHPVLAQVWRGGGRQARLGAFLKATTVHPLDDGKALGRLLAGSGTSDVVDAHLVMLAMRLGDNVLTGDPDDLGQVAGLLGSAAPTIHPWP